VSIPRQIDKKSGVPEEEKGVWGLIEEETTNTFFFPLHFLVLVSYNVFFSLNPELMIIQQRTQFKLCTREGNGSPLQYSCLENPKDGGAWWATVHGVAKSWTQLSDFTSEIV